MAWIALLAGILLQAVVTSLLGLSMTRGDSLVLVAMAAGMCMLCGWFKRPGSTPLVAPRTRSLVWMNVWTAIMFIAFFLGVSLHGAPVVFAIESSFVPFMVVAWTTITARRQGCRRPDVAQQSVAALLAGLGCALVVVLARDNATATTELVAASVMGVIASGGAAAVMILSRQLGRAGVSVAHVMSRRFVLTLALATAGLILLVPAGVIEAPHLGLGIAAVGALASITAPMYLMQFGMQRLAPTSVTAAVATVPAITFVVAMVCGDPVSLSALLLSLLIVPGSVALLMAQRTQQLPVADRPVGDEREVSLAAAST